MPSKTNRQARQKHQVEYEEDDLLIDDTPPIIDPYAVLSVENTASESEIKSAYRRAALQNHPDKVAESEKEAAHAKFQEIAFAYAILSDPRRRSRYDTTGSTEEILEDDDDFNWVDFFREQFKEVVTTEKIDAFAEKYKGSEEERGDVLKAYERNEGSMDRLYQEVMLSDAAEDEERFRKIILEAIEKGEVGEYEKFTQESEKKRAKRVELAGKRKEKDAKEVEKAAKKDEGSGKKKKGGAADANGDLAALIQQRQTGRAENFFDNLEAKYAGTGGKGRKKRTAVDEPPEEAFQKNREKKAKK